MIFKLKNFYFKLNLTQRGLPGGSVVKNLPTSAGDVRDTGLIPGLGRSPRTGNGYPHQYSCLENSMDRGAWWATVHGVAKSWTLLSKVCVRLHTHTHTHTHTHSHRGLISRTPWLCPLSYTPYLVLQRIQWLYFQSVSETTHFPPLPPLPPWSSTIPSSLDYPNSHLPVTAPSLPGTDQSMFHRAARKKRTCENHNSEHVCLLLRPFQRLLISLRIKTKAWTSLVVQWLRIRLPLQGTWVQSLVREDSTRCRATQLVRHD